MNQRHLTFAGLTIAAIITTSPLMGAVNASAPTISSACEALGLETCTVQRLVIRDVERDALELSMVIQGQDRTFRMTPHDVRGPNYQIIVQESDGSFTNEIPGPVTTYRGHDLHVPGTRMALGFEDHGFSIRIIQADGSQWFVEPLSTRLEGAGSDHYAVYRGEDIISPLNECPVDASWRVTDDTSTKSHSPRRSGVILAAEMAVDADYEFFQLYGSVSGVENRVNAVINSVNLQYESEVQLTHEIQAIVVRSENNDPYSTNSIETRLSQLQNDWNSNNHPGIQRDLVHLFTGVDTGSTIGLAYVGAICTNSEYGVVQSSCCGSFGCATDLSAHEMGHNWNAEHCNCPSYTMNPSLTCANQFTTETESTINSFANLIQGCLSVAGPSGACCLGSSCQELSQQECLDIGGVFQGDGINCVDVTCVADVGACCLVSGSCASVSVNQCNAVGGDYQGDNVPCDDEICIPDPVGACCYADSCSVLEEDLCTGSWLGPDTSCDPNPCTANEFSGLSWKVVGTNLADTPQDTWTVDIYALMGPNERLDAVAGNSSQLKTVSSTDGFWQSFYGGATSQEVNPGFYDLVPDLPYDSRVTIGALDMSGDPFDENNLSNIGIDWTNFENGGAISADDGTWYCLNIHPQGEAQPIVTDDCQEANGVLIARLTAFELSSQVSVAAIFQGRNAADITFQATGSTTASLGDWADCNLNGTNDTCDIANGSSQDANTNGIPDECEEGGCEWDLNGDGATTVDDLLELIAEYQVTYSVDDLLALLADFGCTS